MAAIEHLGIGWFVDSDTIRFQCGGNAYIEYLEVVAEMQERGIGRLLLAAAEDAARQLGKRILWLHADEQNLGAHRKRGDGRTMQPCIHPGATALPCACIG